MKHLVNQLRIEIHCPNEDQALQLRHNFSLALQQQIEVVIDRICSRYIQEDEWIRVDKLEIDLGTFSSHTFYETFADIFSGKFEDALVQKLTSVSSEERKESIPRSQAELLRYFLLSGTVPWWADEQALDINVIASEQLQMHVESFRSFLQRNRSNENMWRRIVLQLNRDIRNKIISIFPLYIEIVRMYKSWIETILKKENITLRDTGVTDAILTDIVLEHASALSGITNTKSLQPVFENSISQIFSTIPEAAAANVKDAWNEIKEQDTKSLTAAEGIEESTAPADTTPAGEKYISNFSGAVLLAQFLRPFFQKLNLLNGIAWKNKAAQYKGVQLVRFLCTGEQKTPEYSLVLEKLLCGIPIEEPVPVDTLLQQEERDEASTLLNAVIEHWQALRNTSVEGLRNSFLMRDGSISRNHEHWLLQVERKTMDVLLEKLPWGYSTITLPWNNYLIYVEW